MITNFLKKLPIEVYVLIIPSLLFVSFFNIFNSIPIKEIAKNFFDVFNLVFLSAPLVFLCLFVYFKLGILSLKKISSDSRVFNFGKIREYGWINKTKFSLFCSVLFVFFYITISLYMMVSFTSFLYHTVRAEKVAFFSEKLMMLDYSLFGVYPPFWLQKFNSLPLFDWFIVYSYLWLGLIIAIIASALVFKGRFLFRKFVLSFFIAIFIGAPIWFMVPAISPQKMYRLNILEKPIPADISAVILEYKPSERLSSKLESINKIYVAPDGEFLAASVFPSMHIAWGVIVLYFSLQLWPRLFFIFVPWFIGNTIGTFYTFLHYFVDIIPGALVGVLAIAISGLLINFDSKYYKDEKKLFSSLDVLSEDMKELKEYINNVLSFFLKKISFLIKKESKQ